ncbi:MAG: helix-turn-helix domain-containing protein [Burkholderiales bacterium]|nr:helix-turn-helix domain-containing protein [Burkholderiales bacterium]
MTENKRNFDGFAFYKALESTMLARNLTWKQVATETGVGASTLSRMTQGKLPDATSLASLAAWSGLNPADFVRGSSRPERTEPLAMLSSFIHSDPNLTPEGQQALDEVVKATYLRLSSMKQEKK